MHYKKYFYKFFFKILSYIYKGIINIRNYLYDNKWISSISFPFPIICIGNISVGGTGKTPHVEYLIRLLKNTYKVIILSRGYGRKTKKFILANKYSTAINIGDEPLQYFKKFKNQINVAVDKNRIHGIKKLCINNTNEVLLLDDGFQHRRVKAGLNILLTDFYNLYSEDTLLPIGNLRENKNQTKRAQIIIVTKCPNNLNKSLQKNIIKKLKPKKYQKIFFSYIQYDKYLKNYKKNKIPISIISGKKILLITGIANPNPLIKFLKKKCIQLIHLSYNDHYNFQKKDFLKINKIFNDLKGKKCIITTEKDYMRIITFNLLIKHILYITIFTKINKKKYFDQKIINYVKSTTRIRKVL